MSRSEVSPVENLALLIDFGSTFTKLTAVDLEKEEIIGKAKSPTSVKEDIMIGLNNALKELEAKIGAKDYKVKLASSSAAGGLKMVAVGLVPELTLEAAKRAALGAGANLIGTFAYELTQGEISQIEELSPDILLLCGGTDGGNKDVVVHNAGMLAQSRLNSPFVYAGNKVVADACRNLLEQQGKEVIITENVMPRLGELNVEKVRQAIREVFIKRIIKAKGLDKARRYVDSILMPTPTAVLKAATLLADGFQNEEGLGELVVVDVGGATTDVHSVGLGGIYPGAVKKGVPEPYAKRTVEGDLGVRYNAPSILAAVGREGLETYLGKNINNLNQIIENLTSQPERLPQTEEEQEVDTALACAAVDVAVERHVGTLEIVQLPFGEARIQQGKNLMETRIVIGTGGPIVNNPRPRMVLEKACFNPLKPFSLKPQKPRFFLDEKYALYAFGLLSEVFPQKALRLAKRYLKELKDSGETAS